MKVIRCVFSIMLICSFYSSASATRINDQSEIRSFSVDQSEGFANNNFLKNTTATTKNKSLLEDIRAMESKTIFDNISEINSTAHIFFTAFEDNEKQTSDTGSSTKKLTYHFNDYQYSSHGENPSFTLKQFLKDNLKEGTSSYDLIYGTWHFYSSSKAYLNRSFDNKEMQYDPSFGGQSDFLSSDTSIVFPTTSVEKKSFSTDVVGKTIFLAKFANLMNQTINFLTSFEGAVFLGFLYMFVVPIVFLYSRR